MNRASFAGLLVAGLVAAAVSTALAPARAEDAPAKPEYVGPDNCKKCHLKHFKSWKVTGMAKSLESLLPDKQADKKKAAKLDPSKDFSKDPSCLKCHTTGYGKDSGFPAVVEGKAWTPAEQERATKFGGVTCEACHGPGSLYGPYKKDHEQFKLEEIQKLGATTPPTAAQCLACHTKDCPTMPADYQFDFAKAKAKADAFHEHVPLKFPH
jgi:hypothetical protein